MKLTVLIMKILTEEGDKTLSELARHLLKANQGGMWKPSTFQAGRSITETCRVCLRGLLKKDVVTKSGEGDDARYSVKSG